MEHQAPPANGVGEKPQSLSAEPRMRTHGWVTAGDVRLTVGEWHLLNTLITRPELQSASNDELERERAGRLHSTVATDLDELEIKGLLIVHGSEGTKTHPRGRQLLPTVLAREAAARL